MKEANKDIYYVLIRDVIHSLLKEDFEYEKEEIDSFNVELPKGAYFIKV